MNQHTVCETDQRKMSVRAGKVTVPSNEISQTPLIFFFQNINVKM